MIIVHYCNVWQHWWLFKQKENLPSAAMTNLTWGSTWSTRSGNRSAIKSNSVTSIWCLVKCRFLSAFALIIGKMSPLSMSETVSWHWLLSATVKHQNYPYRLQGKTLRPQWQLNRLHYPVPRWFPGGWRSERGATTNQPIANSPAIFATLPCSNTCWNCALKQLSPFWFSEMLLTP